MLKKYTIILLFISCLSANSQDAFEEDILIYKKECIYQQTVDSVKIGFYFFSSKETSSYVLDLDGKVSDEDISDEFRLIKEATLTAKEVKQFNKSITSKRYYCNQQALLGHIDIGFDYYRNDSIVQRIRYSSITRNFIVFDENDEIIIRNSANKKLHHLIAKLLQHHETWNSELEFNFYENYLGNC